MIIAIDGPAASGKSTTAKLVAKKLKVTYLDTGAMYRAVTLQLLRSKIDFVDIDKVSAILDDLIIDMFDHKGVNIVKINDEDVTGEIRSSNVTKYVSEVSALLSVRESMVVMQREIGHKTDCVIEGRDIGTIVFPNADYKFFMVADIKMRAKRRLKEMKQFGIVKSVKEVISELESRDQKDSSRDNSPLRKAKDAIEIDTSNLSIDEQVDKIIDHIKIK
ncbi:MAG: (d)CMP kinase [Candidatus Neomarinimicrobiota bacterium]|jgi:cytidylate kinase|nr:(d)CMP kinase [Candidatus Neomarinimicrobiota bacterium]MED5256441.1 (d)CMP kinase [Candidatus Neomarinimicrobiota bacterium]MED5267003.1 (d)CMP kinase [Candidatus Neomarinimicrobiota bacterium]|tara:strand:+ start:1327 stop:1983 length:657 start_codon:yes stop_codon:yes gene_type:complete